MIEIKHRFTNNTMFAYDAGNMRDAILQAVKSGANLSRANLSGAYLSGADRSGAKYGDATMERGIIQLLGLRWPVLIFDAHIKIGCQLHPTKEWAEFDDSAIAEMNDEATEFWSAHKSVILTLAKHTGE